MSARIVFQGVLTRSVAGEPVDQVSMVICFVIDVIILGVVIAGKGLSLSVCRHHARKSVLASVNP